MSVSALADVPAAAGRSVTAVEKVFQFTTGFIITSALNVIVKLGIPDRLASGPRTAGELARTAGVHEDALYRVLRTLAGVGFFVEDAQKRFALTEMSALLRVDAERSLRPMVHWMGSPFHFRVYAALMHSVRTGQPAIEHLYGMPAFEYLANDQDLSEIFNDAMTAFSAGIVPAVLQAYDFSETRVLVDVAGGHGMVLTSILERYPSMRGLLTDVDHVIDGAIPRIAQLGLADRCDTAVIDFFEAVPRGGDTYVMQHIIHDWDDARAITILRNTRDALDGVIGGRLLLLEGIVAPANQPDLTKLIDIEMLLMPGGRERSEEEYRALLQAGGFELTRVVPTQSQISVIEARPIDECQM